MEDAFRIVIWGILYGAAWGILLDGVKESQIFKVYLGGIIMSGAAAGITRGIMMAGPFPF